MKIFSRHISKPTGSGADLVGVPPKESKRFLSASLTAPEDQAFIDLSKKLKQKQKTKELRKLEKNTRILTQIYGNIRENTLKWLRNG